MGYGGIDDIIRKQGYLLLDGALGTEIERRGCPMDPVLWSAGVLRDDPDKIAELYLEYLNSGVDCLTTATYQLSYQGGLDIGLQTRQIEELFLLSTALARNAIRIYHENSHNRGKLKFVAASLGPYGAYLANGAEYTGDYEAGEEVLNEFHFLRLDILIQSKPDVILFETIPSFRETCVIASLIRRNPETMFWLSFQCQDGTRIADGTPIRKCISQLENLPNLKAIGANCIEPSIANDVISELSEIVGNRELILYPNKGGCYNGVSKSWDFKTDNSDLFRRYGDWHHMGVRILGGCCGFGPDEMKEIKKTLVASI